MSVRRGSVVHRVAQIRPAADGAGVKLGALTDYYATRLALVSAVPLQ